MERHLLFKYCFPFLCWIKFCSGWFRKGFFTFGRQRKWLLVALERWSFYSVAIVWELAWADSALVILDKWSSFSSLFHMKITVSVTKSSHEDSGLCYLCLQFFLYTHSPPVLEIKSCFDCCFPQQIRPQTTVQWYKLWDYSSVRIGFNIINKCHTQPISYTMLVKIH